MSSSAATAIKKQDEPQVVVQGPESDSPFEAAARCRPLDLNHTNLQNFVSVSAD